MSDVAIVAENLGKLYRIGSRNYYKTFRDALSNALSAPFRKLRNELHPDEENSYYTWALRNVSFSVRKGEIVGVIGHNGSGKTTLLKILSRITPPTEGMAKILGSVSTLLEVGTGFHPELTGRDNVYLSGAIMGMQKREISNRFDEIVSFAEVERFIDTPIKRYSVGMHLRLAFAVAAHLEPEILLVDEVLAVGDLGFQKKCLGKMGEVVRGGRTVLFVSHNMAAISQLCQRTLWLHKGHLQEFDATEKVIANYIKTASQDKGEVCWGDTSGSWG